MRLQPWQDTFNGRTWRDMPGVGEDNKKLNFFLYRRGMLDVEDETTCETLAADGITEVAMAEGALSARKPKLISRWKTRFGSHGRKPGRKYDTPKESEPRSVGRPASLTPEEQTWRAQLRLRLGKIRQGHLSAVRTIAEKAGVIYSTLNKFVYEGTGMGTALLGKVSTVADEYESGALPLRLRKKAEKNGVEVPAGCVPYKEWLAIEAAKRNCQPHSLRVYLQKHPTEQPLMVKLHARCFFVKLSTEAAA
jgi:hypothetical protein